MQFVEYYQIGGFGGHVNLHPYTNHKSNEALASRLMQTQKDGAELELVLGIRPNGASYLLLPVGKVHALRLRMERSRKHPWRADEFKSLSPIQFGAKPDLVAKLNMLTSNKKSTDGPPRDRSKANTQYTAGGDDLSSAGITRSSFEHQRVFYRLCQKTISDPWTSDFALAPARQFDDVRIYSFAFNLWAMDTRGLSEREASPKVLDVGWTEFDSPTDASDLKAVSTTHLNVESELFLRNPGRSRLAIENVTESMSRASIETLLKTLFAEESHGDRAPPKLLLVHDERMTRCVLQSFGVDMSRWETGIEHLLYSQESKSRQHDHFDAKSDPRGRPGKRERSLSPRRAVKDECYLSSHPRSPSPQRNAPPVCMVDVRRMFQYLMEVPPRNDTILNNAKALLVRDVVQDKDDGVKYEDVDLSKWCAGRESRLLGYMWEDMANGGSIDEQRDLRRTFYKEEPVDVRDEQDNGEDVDPNDIYHPEVHSAGPARASKPVGMFDSEDEDDYC